MARKNIRTVPVHARIPESDVAELDEAAEAQPIPVSRSHMIALIVRQWVDAKHNQSRPGMVSPGEAGRGKADQGSASIKRRRLQKR